MRTNKWIVCLPIVMLVLVAFSGCTTAAKETVGLVRGASGVYAPLQEVTADSLGQYRRFEIGPIVDDFGGKVPSDLMSHFQTAFAEELADKKLPNDPAGKTLLIRGRFFHYEDAGTLGAAIGPLEEVLARLELVDKDTNQVLGVANCIGRTTNRVNLGVPKKGQGLAKAIVSWIDARYPKQGREE